MATYEIAKTLNGMPYPQRVEAVNADGTAIGSAATISGALPAGANLIGNVGVRSTRTTATVTIADATSLSPASSAFGGKTLAGVITPAAWTTAGISFQVSVDGVTFFVLLDTSGTEVTAAAVAASRYVPVDPSLFLGVEYVKIQSGTSGATTNQAGGDIVTLVLV